jgi:phage terminase Nu1 subunit (DNA packaging protein)
MMQFNRGQIGEAFGVELTTVDKWRRSGCPSVKTGKSVMFSVREVSDWLRSRDMESSGTLDLGQELAKLAKLQIENTKLPFVF